MALANVAVVLTQWGHRVLVVDWDLEAPGIENFFREYTKIKAVFRRKGIVDLLENIDSNSVHDSLPWKECINRITLPDARNKLHLITAGMRDTEYFSRVRKLDINTMYSTKDGGAFIESMRNEWKSRYDYVLIDSRTGVTDIGGICTIQLPDMLVLFFGSNEQSLNGVIDIAKKATTARQKLPIARLKLALLPIPSRFDAQEEFVIAQEWLGIFEKKLRKMYADWLPSSVTARHVLEVTKLPYIPYFSFGEKLPVIEQGTSDPSGLGYAYENLAALIANKLELIEIFVDSRDLYMQRASKKAKGLVDIHAYIEIGTPSMKTAEYDYAYLDIETTGLSFTDSEISIIGIYLVKDSDTRLLQLIGKEITKNSLLMALKGVKTIFTYNGQRFDAPFIKGKLGIDLIKDYNHIDLMYESWRHSLYGGLKAVEAQLGISRKSRGISGLDSIKLWEQYKVEEDNSALATLLESNKEDIENLRKVHEKLLKLPPTPILPTGEIVRQPLAGIGSEELNVGEYVKRLASEGKPQDIKAILRITRSILQPQIDELVRDLNASEPPQQVQRKQILSQAYQYISKLEPLVQKVEQFSLYSIQEEWADGVKVALRLAGDWISASERSFNGRVIRSAQGAPALLAWRMLSIMGAKALDEESFKLLGFVLREPIEVQNSIREFSNRSYIQRSDLFYPEALLGHADISMRYIAELWGNQPHLRQFFLTERDYHFAIAKFFILAVLAHSLEKPGDPLYPGYQLLPRAREAMSSFLSRMVASESYLKGITQSMGESIDHLTETWAGRVKSINNVNLGSPYILRDEVLFPDKFDSQILD